MNLFSKKEMKQFNNLQNIDYSSCSILQNQIQSILSDKRIRENGGYNGYLFSQVISLSDSKKCILFMSSARNKNYTGGKIVGTEIMYILSKDKDRWKLTDKRGLAMY